MYAGLILLSTLVVLAAVALLALGWLVGAASERQRQYLAVESTRDQAGDRLYQLTQDAVQDLLAAARGQR